MKSQNNGQASGQATSTAKLGNIENTGQATGQVDESIKRVVIVINGEVKRNEIQEALELRHRVTFLNNYLNPAMEQGYIEQTIPDKLTSPNQRYRLTEKGRILKTELEKL